MKDNFLLRFMHGFNLLLVCSRSRKKFDNTVSHVNEKHFSANGFLAGSTCLYSAAISHSLLLDACVFQFLHYKFSVCKA